MEETVKRARKKAEGFLFKEVAKFRTDLKNKSNDILDRPHWNLLPLQFEAQAYLAHKTKALKPKYAEEIRNLWQHWINTKEDEQDILNIFYSDDPCWGLFEVSISMFRAMEVLGIPGFQNYFNYITRELGRFLADPPIDFDNHNSYSNLWLIFRSITVQEKLDLYIKHGVVVVLDKIKSREPMVHFYKDYCDDLLNSIIFFVLSKNEGDYLKTAKLLIDSIIYFQENNGSILNDLFTTSLFVTAVVLTNTDPSRIILPRALKWILSKQDKNGSWNLWGSGVHIDQNERILSTVIVLEAIDLITNNKPLPPWIPIEKVEDVKIKRPPRVRDVQPLDINPDIKWKNVNMSFSSPKSVRILAGNVIQKDFRSMGFMNENTEEPDILWATLLLFAIHLEGISWKTKGIPPKISKNLKTNKKDLGNRLKWLFQTNEKPFEDYGKLNLYKPKFDIFIGGDFNKEEYLKLIDEIVCSKY